MIKFLNSPERPKQSDKVPLFTCSSTLNNMGPRPPLGYTLLKSSGGSCAENNLCSYDLYSPVHNVLDACIFITWGSGRGLGPGILEFFGPS